MYLSLTVTVVTRTVDITAFWDKYSFCGKSFKPLLPEVFFLSHLAEYRAKICIIIVTAFPFTNTMALISYLNPHGSEQYSLLRLYKNKINAHSTFLVKCRVKTPPNTLYTLPLLKLNLIEFQNSKILKLTTRKTSFFVLSNN